MELKRSEKKTKKKKFETFFQIVTMKFFVSTYIRGFTKFEIVKATVFGVFEDLKFKISEGSDQN